MASQMASQNYVTPMTSFLSEHAEQVELIQMCLSNVHRYPQLANLFAIPNGGDRSAITGRKLKMEGVKCGVPDLFLAVPSGDYHGLFIEMKTANGRVQPAQKEWMDRLNKAGYTAVVCRGADEAWNTIIQYLSTTTTIQGDSNAECNESPKRS